MDMGNERYRTIGFDFDAFKRLCHKQGYAPSRVAMFANVPPSTLTRWKKIGRVRHNSVKALCRVLRVPIAAVRVETSGRAKRRKGRANV